MWRSRAFEAWAFRVIFYEYRNICQSVNVWRQQGRLIKSETVLENAPA